MKKYFLLFLFQCLIGTVAAQQLTCGVCRGGNFPRIATSAIQQMAQRPIAPLQESSLTMIDYLLVYDPSGVQYAESVGGVEKHAHRVVDLVNQVFENSGIAARFRLAGTMTIEENAPRVDAGLGQIISHEGVRNYRKEVQADIVALCTEPTTYDGLAGIAIYESDAYSAYCSLRASAAYETYTAAHEIGHVFGCQHSRETLDGGTHPYAVGAVRAPYFTVMGFAIGDEVTISAPIFSSPHSVWNGVTLGSATEDCVRKIKERLAEVSAFGNETNTYQVSQTYWNAPYHVAELNVELKANTFYFVNSDSPWLQVTPDKGYRNTTLKLQVRPNLTGALRTGKVTISGDDTYTPAVITVLQDAEGVTSITSMKAQRPTYTLSNHRLTVVSAQGLRLRVYSLKGALLLEQRITKEQEVISLPIASTHVIVKFEE